MNKNYLSIRRIGWSLLILIQSNLIISQQTEITFSQTGLNEVIKTLEENTDLIFNYNPQVVKEYTFSGSLDLSSPAKCIEQLLYDTPLVFSKGELAMVIYKPEPSLYKICGTIKDSLSKEPLIGVNVYADDIITGSQTDQNGYFELSVRAYKNQSISMSYIGYNTFLRQVQDLVAEDCRTIVLSINNQIWSEEIVITDFILDGISEESDFNGYSMDYIKLSKHHSTVEHDILKTAQILPGISSLDESAANLQIRGGTADQNLILWEGAPLYQSGHLFGMISAINPFSINNVEIHKGVYDPKYDNRVGGVIDISMADSIGSKQLGSIGLTFTEAHANLETPIIEDKLAVVVAGRYSMSNLFNSPPLKNYTNKVIQFSIIDDQSEGVQNGTANGEQTINFYDWNAKVLYKPVKDVLINVGMYRNSQDFEYKFSILDDPFNTTDKIVTETEALNAKVDWELNTNWTSSISYMQSKYKSQYDYVEEELGTFQRDYVQFNDIYDRSFILSNTFRTSSLEINSGYDYNIKRVNYNITDDKILDPYFEDNNFEEGHFHNLFASIKLNHKQLSITGGIRSSYYEEQERWIASPRLGLQYYVNRNLKIKAEGGIFHQFISQLRDFGSNGIASENPIWILNDVESELSQRAKKVAVGFNYHANGWLVDLEAFHNQTDGLSTLSPIFKQSAINDFSRGNSKVSGLGLLVKKRWPQFNSWINYSLGKISYSFPDLSENSFAAPNDILHNISLVNNYQYKDIQFSMICNYHSGLPFSEPSGIETIFDEVDDETYYNIEYQAVNEQRLKPYARVDLSINYRPVFNLIGKSRVELSFSVLNVFNRENVFAREYYTEDNGELEGPDLSFIRKSLLKRTPLALLRVYW